MKLNFIKKQTGAFSFLMCMAILLCFQKKASAQFPASAYSFTAVSGTYTSITGGTVLTAVQQDDNYSATQNLGFNFNYCGVVYTQFKMCSNGWLTFNTAVATYDATNSAADVATFKPALLVLDDDLSGASPGSCRYLVTGTAPNRVFTMQCSMWRWWYNSSAPNISFQINLYETTNVIEYVYQQEASAGTPTGGGGATIGIADGGATMGYLTLNNTSTAPVASSTVFTTGLTSRPATGQIYRFTPPPPCNLATGFPTTGSVVATPNAVCGSGNVSLTFTPATALPATTGLSYKWQTSPTATGTYTDIPGAVTTTATYTTTVPVAATSYFKCVLLCNGSSTIMTSAASNVVSITNPGTATGTGASRCGPGTVNLAATSSVSGTNLHWYTTATGGAPIGTGSPWTTPYTPSTTNYYVASEINTPLNATIGTGTLTNQYYTYPSPLGQYFTVAHDQYLIKASELTAVGFSAGTLTSVSFDNVNPLVATNASFSSSWVQPLQQYQIMMGNTTVSAMTTSLITNPTGGFTTVVPAATYTPPYGTTGFVLTFTFATPFIWDGVSNVVMDISFTDAGPSPGCSSTFNYSDNAVVHQTATTFASSLSISADANCTISSMTPGTTGTTYNQRPNMKFIGTGTCANARVPVAATITPAPATTLTTPAVVCSGETEPLIVASSPMTNYTNYAWTPNVTDLYSNAGATTPYTTGSAPTVYLKSTTNGTHTFYLFSSGATPAACTHADTISVWVQPDSITIAGAPDTICTSGSTILSLMPNTGYATNSIQWQQSADGVVYANVTGATSANYTTPTLTTDHYYRALIKSTHDTCEMPVKHIVVANPQLLSAPDSFTCGPGPVTLTAYSAGNATPKWYNTAIGGSPIFTGSQFVTPYLGATTTYYVAAEGGAAVPIQYQDGTGTSIDGGLNYDPGPFCAYYSNSIQMLYTATEIIALGGGAGNLSSVAFDCTGLPAVPLTDYRIAIKFVPSTMTTLASWQTGLTEVYVNPSFLPTATGYITFPFNNLQGWNGTDNIVVQVCKASSTYSNTGNHHYTSKANRTLTYNGYSYASSCGTAGSATTSSLPNIKFGIEKICGTPRTLVHAYVRPKPVVDLGPDVNMCVDAGQALVLNAGVQPNGPQFLWDDNSTSQIRAVTGTGTYAVKVTNMYTCASSDTVNIILRKNPAINLGSDTSVCNGVNLTLDPGNAGVEYFWSTGQTSESITVDNAGSYNVFVTNDQGCTAADTIQVSMNGELPAVQGIQISNNGQFTFNFTAVNPQNVIGYDWDFGDSTTHSYMATPTHVYAHSGNYIVVLRLSSTCGFLSDSTSAHIVGIHQINVSNNELSVYPNPTKNTATISISGDLKMEKVDVYNVLGQVIYSQKADSNTKHIMDLSRFASGMYTIEVYTDKGTVARKLEVVK